MTKTILYSGTNQVRKGAEIYVKTGDVLSLADNITSDTIVVAENTNDSFLKGLSEQYGIKVVPMNLVKDGLSYSDELLVDYHLNEGNDITKVSAITGIPETDIAFSKAFFGKSRIEKVVR